jgi:hypothetical protein
VHDWLHRDANAQAALWVTPALRKFPLCGFVFANDSPTAFGKQMTF